MFYKCFVILFWFYRVQITIGALVEIFAPEFNKYLVCILSVWHVFCNFGMYSVVLVCILLFWYVFYNFGMYSIVLVCILLFWYVFYCFGMYSVILVCIRLF